MTESTIKHQKNQLVEMRALIRETTTEEHELIDRLQVNSENAEKIKVTSQEQAEKSFVDQRELAAEVKVTAIEKIENRTALEPQVLKDKHEQRVIEINSNAEELTESIESKLNEAIWLAESVFEGAIAGPREQAQRAQNALEDSKEKLELLCEEAPRTLSRLRHTSTLSEGESSSKIDRSMESYTTDAQQA